LGLGSPGSAAFVAETCGFDPALAFLHELDGNRPSLPLDLMEPFRAPLADRLVLTLVNRQQFSPEDFEPAGPAEGLHLTHGALQRFLGEYEKWMLAPVAGPATPRFRDLLQAEVRRFARALLDRTEWNPFRWPYEKPDPPQDSTSDSEPDTPRETAPDRSSSQTDAHSEPRP
jgi:CRISPR-associated endonuclease Cas1